MRTSECYAKKELPFTINIVIDDERKKLDSLGQEIASKEGLNYEGYTVTTLEPYSLDKAKAILFFN